MGKRRFHNKSRQGCLQCKKNRTKCDQIQPKCGRCERIGAECTLSNQTSELMFITVNPTDGQQEQAEDGSPETKSDSHSLSPEQTNISLENTDQTELSKSSIGQAAVQSQFTDVEREQLKLMTHYTLYASKSITEITVPEDRDHSIWAHWVTELAFQNDFLLHGLLSLSALHLALSREAPQKHRIIALHHYDIGVALFRSLLCSITASNFDAIFAFSCFVTFYSFGIQQSSILEGDPIARIYEVLILARKSAAMSKFNQQTLLRQSRWSVLMLPDVYPFTQSLPEPMEDMLSKLLQCNSTAISLASQRDMYNSAIQDLRDNLIIAVTYPQSPARITYLAFAAPAAFWEMVYAREPLALAILANYAVILHWLRGSIWMNGWGKETVDAVRQSLPLEWHHWIAWAIQETDNS